MAWALALRRTQRPPSALIARSAASPGLTRRRPAWASGSTQGSTGSPSGSATVAARAGAARSSQSGSHDTREASFKVSYRAGTVTMIVSVSTVPSSVSTFNVTR